MVSFSSCVHSITFSSIALRIFISSFTCSLLLVGRVLPLLSRFGARFATAVCTSDGGAGLARGVAVGAAGVVVVVVVAGAAPKTRAGGTWVAAPGELKVNGDVGSEVEEVRGADGDCGAKGKPSPRWWGLGTSNDIDANGDNGVVTGPAVGVEVVVAAATTEVAVAEEAAVMPVTSAGSEAEGCSCWATTMGVASFLASISMIRDEGVEEDEGVDDDEDEDEDDEERMKPNGRDGPALPALG
jgi:hypothetical protein